jgi:hypothetical protein
VATGGVTVGWKGSGLHHAQSLGEEQMAGFIKKAGCSSPGVRSRPKAQTKRKRYWRGARPPRRGGGSFTSNWTPCAPTRTPDAFIRFLTFRAASYVPATSNWRQVPHNSPSRLADDVQVAQCQNGLVSEILRAALTVSAKIIAASARSLPVSNPMANAFSVCFETPRLE